MKKLKIAGFIIEGDNIIVSNPCTIPTWIMEDALKSERKKNQVSYVGWIEIKIPKGVLKE